MPNYAVVNSTKFIVPSTASDEVVRVFFNVFVPTDVIQLQNDEDVSAAAYVIQEHWHLSHGLPTLENWPSTIQLDAGEVNTVLTRDAVDKMKERIRKQRR